MDADVHERKEHSRERFVGQLAESRALLGDHLALYQVHSLTHDSPLFTDVPLLRAMADAAAGGLRLGFSATGPRQADTVRRALDVEVDGRRLFTAVQATWNPLETSVEPALREAHDAGVHVLVKETLANGRLAVRPAAAVSASAARHQVGPDAVAIAAALHRPWADTVLVGPASRRQLRANLAATAVTLDAADVDALAGSAVPPEAYWAERAALPWT